MRVSHQGAIPLENGSTRFRVWAPYAEQVVLTLDDRDIDLETSGFGYFETVADVPTGTRYRYRLDGGAPTPDPASRSQPEGVHGPSTVFDAAAFGWSDGRWRGRALGDLVIYEAHIGAFTAPGTLDAAIEHLRDLAELGVTAFELMPVAQFPGARNWGYDGVFPFAVQDSYGGPAALQRFVDAAHAEGLAVILDVVYNHLGPEGNRLADFGPYFTDVYQTPWGRAINFDQSGSDEVRRFFLDNALMWFTDFHIDALRLDAIHGIVDRTASPFLRELADEVHALAGELGRPLLLIAESDSNDPAVVSPDGLGMDAQWADDFHHAVHALLTGERDGYYADYGAVTDVAKAMRQGFVLDGRFSYYRLRRHGAPPVGVPRERFVVAVQNHDQIGNRMNGDRLSTLVGDDRLRLAAALLVLSPCTPLFFMGEEYAEETPFLYFVSHSDPELVEAVRTGRAAEFAGFEWSGDPPDPQDEKTFMRSKLDRSVRGSEHHAAFEELVRDLLALRRRIPSDTVEVTEEEGVITVVRSSAEQVVRSRFNCTSDTVALDDEGSWSTLMRSAARTDPALEPWGFLIEMRSE